MKNPFTDLDGNNVNTIDKQGFSDRLNAVLDAAGIAAKGKGRQDKVASLFGVSQKGARKWLEGESVPRYEKLKKIVERFKATGVTVEWLLTGDLDLAPWFLTADECGSYISENMKTTVWKVPVIRWADACSYLDHMETPHMLTLQRPEEWVTTCIQPRAGTFALRIKDNTLGHDFPEGASIIVDPNLEPVPDDYIIVCDGDVAVFKQLVADGPDLYLKPIDPRFPIKPLGEQKIIGVVRELVRRFR